MQGYSDTRWSKRHAGQQAQDWSLPRAWTGPVDSKQGFPGAVPAAKSLPTRGLREPTGTGSVSGLSSVFLGPKSNEVWFRSRERVSPSQEMPHPGKMGRGTRTLLLGAILKCWAVYPWDPMRGCGNGGRVGVEGREGSSQKGTPCGRPWDRSCHMGAQEEAPLKRPPPRQPVPCSVLVGLWKWVAEQRALISSCQHDVGKNTPWKTRLRPGTKIATVPPPGSRYQQREFVQVERPILFTVCTLARGRESFTHRTGRGGPSGHSWNAAPRTDVAWGVSQAAPQPVARRQGTAGSCLSTSQRIPQGGKPRGRPPPLLPLLPPRLGNLPFPI